MVGYLPIKLNLNPVKKIIHISFDADELYKSFEFQYLESFERGKGYRVLATKLNEEVDIYEDENLIKEKNEKFSCFFNRKGKQYTVEFESPKMEINEEILSVYIEFVDYKKRKIIIDIKDNVKKTECFDLLDKNGHTINHPDFVPLVFLYDMAYISKKAKYSFMIDNKKMKIAKTIEGYPKADFGARYSLNVQAIEFGVNEGIEMIDLSHELTTDGFKYVFKEEKLVEISLSDEKIPFKVIFDPGLPQKVGKGKFVINTSKNMGKIVGTYNNVVNGKKIKGKISLGKWNPNNVKNIKVLSNEKNVFRSWLTHYELSLMVDLEVLEYTSKWINSKGAGDEEIY